MNPEPPVILLLNQQKKWKTNPIRLKRDLRASLNEVTKSHPFPSTIREIEFLLVTPTESADIHQQFFHDNSPTDVMTFSADPLASIVICPEIARKQRHTENLSLHAEVLTYAIHGLLHLCGLDDQTTPDFMHMKSEQTRIRSTILQSK